MRVALDAPGNDALGTWAALAQLHCAGVPLDLSTLPSAPALEHDAKDTKPAPPSARVHLHRPLPRIPARDATTAEVLESASSNAVEIMAPAPTLPSAWSAALDLGPLPEPETVLIEPPYIETHDVLPVQTGDAVADGLVVFHRQVAEAHQSFLALQSQLMAALMQSGSAPASATDAFTGLIAPTITPSIPAPVASITSAVAEPASSLSRALARPTPLSTPAPKLPRDEFTGPALDRDALRVHAGGNISRIFGEAFARQDGFTRQVRMPQPPLLLADRVLGIDAVPGAMQERGRVWTETDVRADAWYMHHGHMPAGIVIESGQADLLLISYMGADFDNRGERVYRLLGCEMTFRAGLPAAGDTLRYDIHVDGHARQGPQHLFFFHYDCDVGGRRLLEVRNGQAGFFSDAELAASGGVLWRADDHPPAGGVQIEPAPIALSARAFSREEVQCYFAGDIAGCFGEAFAATRCHTRTPCAPGGALALFDEVEVYDPHGGPWGGGYMRAKL